MDLFCGKLSEKSKRKQLRRGGWTCAETKSQKKSKRKQSRRVVWTFTEEIRRKSPKGSRAGESSGLLRKKSAEKVQKEAEQASGLDLYRGNPQKKSKRKQSRRVVWTFTEEIRRKSPKGSSSGQKTGPLRM